MSASRKLIPCHRSRRHARPGTAGAGTGRKASPVRRRSTSTRSPGGGSVTPSTERKAGRVASAGTVAWSRPAVPGELQPRRQPPHHPAPENSRPPPGRRPGPPPPRPGRTADRTARRPARAKLCLRRLIERLERRRRARATPGDVGSRGSASPRPPRASRTQGRGSARAGRSRGRGRPGSGLRPGSRTRRQEGDALARACRCRRGSGGAAARGDTVTSAMPSRYSSGSSRLSRADQGTKVVEAHAAPSFPAAAAAASALRPLLQAIARSESTRRPGPGSSHPGRGPSRCDRSSVCAVDRDAERRARLVHPAVAPADRPAVVVEAR